jgi:hypothetical protein
MIQEDADKPEPGCAGTATPHPNIATNPNGTTVPEGSVSPELKDATAPDPKPVDPAPEPSNERQQERPAQGHTTETPAPRAPRVSAWAVATWFCGWASRPRVRLTMIGLVLIVTGGLLVTSSMWTLPLVIVGALMVMIAWVGGRLDGRFAIEWGQAGTQLEFRARITAPQPTRLGMTPVSVSSRALVHLADPERPVADVIQGEAHRLEVDVAELKALIAAAETEDAEVAQAAASARATRELRIARADERASEAPLSEKASLPKSATRGSS